MSALIILAFSAAASAQDTVGSIEIRAPRTTVLVARTLQLQATAANDFGRPLTGFQPRWRSTDPEIASIDQNGAVSGRTPGICDIEAADPVSGVSDRITLRVYPARLEFVPENPLLDIGGQTRLSVRVLDADGGVIAGVQLAWQSGLPGVASVDADGVVHGVSEGSTTIAALVQVGSRSYQFSGQTQVRVRRRPDFLTSRVLSNEQEASPVSLASIPDSFSGISFAANGDVAAFIGSLSNGSRALMLHQNGVLRRLATTGEYREASGSVLRNIQSVSVSAAGDVLARLLFGACEDAWVLFRGSTSQTVLSGCGYPQAMLGERGEIAYVGPGQRSATLNLRKSDGSTQVLLADGATLPGFGSNIGYTINTVTGLGHVLFSVCDNRGCFAHFWNGSSAEKLPTANDTVDGKFLNWSNNAVETSTGDLFFQGGNDQGSRLFRRSRGVWSTLVENNGAPLTDVNGVGCAGNQMSAVGDALVFTVCSSQTPLFYRWQADRFEKIAPADGSCEFFAASQGAVVYRECSGARIVRATASGNTNLATAGTSLAGTVPTSIVWQDLRIAGSGANLATPSVADGLLRLATRESLITPGQTLPGGATLTRLRFSAANAAGDFVFQADYPNYNSALYTWRNGVATLLVDGSGSYITEIGGRINSFACCSQPMAVNRRNQVVAWTNWSGGQSTSAMMLFTEGSRTARIVAEIDGPKGVGFVNGAALDDRGRVMFYVGGNTGGVWLYDNGQLTKSLTIGATDSRGRLNGINSLVAAGDRFYAMGYYDNLPSLLLEYVAGAWRQATTITNLAFVGTFNANLNNDIAMVVYSNVRSVVVRKADGTEKTVASAAEQTSEGEWLLDILSAWITDSGEIYFTARTASGAKDRLNLYRAVSR